MGFQNLHFGGNDTTVHGVTISVLGLLWINILRIFSNVRWGNLCFFTSSRSHELTF